MEVRRWTLQSVSSSVVHIHRGENTASFTGPSPFCLGGLRYMYIQSMCCTDAHWEEPPTPHLLEQGKRTTRIWHLGNVRASSSQRQYLGQPSLPRNSSQVPIFQYCISGRKAPRPAYAHDFPPDSRAQRVSQTRISVLRSVPWGNPPIRRDYTQRACT